MPNLVSLVASVPCPRRGCAWGCGWARGQPGTAGATFVLGRQAIVDLPTSVIGVLSLVYLWRLNLRLKEPAPVFAVAVVRLVVRGL